MAWSGVAHVDNPFLQFLMEAKAKLPYLPSEEEDQTLSITLSEG